MPNLIIETSRPDLIKQPEQLLQRLNSSLFITFQFGKPEDIKSRIIHSQHVLVGLPTDPNHEFIYVHFYLMKGRDNATQKMLVDTISQAIANHVKDHENLDTQGKLQICVNPIELSEHYQKVTV